MQLRHRRRSGVSEALPAQIRGFSLVEVLVALVVLGVGLLGIAKLESAAFSNTSTAARRSLAALEADSLAATMHVNRGYWTSGDVSNAAIVVQANTVTVASGAGATLAASVAANLSCTSATASPSLCGVADVAAYDIRQWGLALQSLLPNYTATIACGNVNPARCTITITWVENAVAVNSQEASAASAAIAANTVSTFENPSYTLYVQP